MGFGSNFAIEFEKEMKSKYLEILKKEIKKIEENFLKYLLTFNKKEIKKIRREYKKLCKEKENLEHQL